MHFVHKFDFKIIDHGLINKYTILKLNKYVITNTKNYNFSKYIQVNFKTFGIKHFDKLENSI